MPHKEGLKPKKHAFNRLFGQRPLTVFKDYRNSLGVDLIKCDNEEDMLNGVYDFVKATWSLDGRESERATREEKLHALNQMLSGKALQLGLEIVNMTYRITGITRVDTHQIVRNRIGITYSQQCSGDQFWNHMDCLVPRSVQHNNDPEILENFILDTIGGKMRYVDMVDNGVSIQDARHILPHNLETFIFLHTNLATLLFIYQKRIDDGSQTWQYNHIAQMMADKLIARLPSTANAFEKMKKKFTFQRDASIDRENTFSTSLYLPKDDDFDYHEQDFLYQKTKADICKLHQMPMVNRYFWGYKEISQREHQNIQDSYSHNNEPHRLYLTNEEVLEKNLEINRQWDKILKER